MTSRRDVLRGIGSGAALVTLGASTAAAEDDEDEDEDEDEGDEEAGLRVAHASPNAPEVDVLLDGDAAVEGLAFRSVTDYLELSPGEYDIAVNVAETDETVFEAEDVELEAEDYTAVARGEVGEDTDTDFTVDILEDTNGANIGDDESRVRAIHASPDAPAVDVTVNDDALTLFSGFEFGESSGYAVVGAGDYDVELRAAASGDEVASADVTLEGGTTYTIFAEGYLTPDDEPADEPLELIPIQDKSAPPRGDEDDDDDEEDENDDGNGDDNGRGRGRGDD